MFILTCQGPYVISSLSFTSKCFLILIVTFYISWRLFRSIFTNTNILSFLFSCTPKYICITTLYVFILILWANICFILFKMRMKSLLQLFRVFPCWASHFSGLAHVICHLLCKLPAMESTGTCLLSTFTTLWIGWFLIFSWFTWFRLFLDI